ncbi:MAG: hypothetical protein NTAFB05_24350 [Nitrobacter sp.]
MAGGFGASPVGFAGVCTSAGGGAGVAGAAVPGGVGAAGGAGVAGAVAPGGVAGGVWANTAGSPGDKATAIIAIARRRKRRGQFIERVSLIVLADVSLADIRKT